ncbi:hypothetical protein Tco_0648274 [Tanacetum coccineum]
MKGCMPLKLDVKQSLEDAVSKFMNESAKQHEENSNLIKEIRAAMDLAINNQGASIKALEIQIGQMSKSIASVDTEYNSTCRIDPSQYAVFTPLDSSFNFQKCSDKFTFPVDIVVIDMLEDIKTHLILRRPFLSTTHAKIDVFKRKITLRVGNDKIVFQSHKPIRNIIKSFYALSLMERMELDLEARLMGEALIVNMSYDLEDGDFIKLNDLNKPLELSSDQVADLGPTIEEGKVIDAPMLELVKAKKYDDGTNDYPSFCDHDRKIHVNGRYNLRFSCMIGFKHVNANFFPFLSINIMSKSFYNSIMKDKIEYKGKNVVGAFMNVPIFVGTFHVVVDFAVMENMDAYRGNEMGDVIMGKEFCNKVGVIAKRFEEMITIDNGNDIITYQMARSHPRFEHITNEQCNKIRPLLKISADDVLDGILNPYQKLRKLDKGVLNLGLEYLIDDEVKKWLTHGHVSVHEMEWYYGM